MAIKRILKYGEQELREPSKEVIKVSRKIQDLVQDLLDTMYNAQNGVGLAAPQIGVNLRVFVIDVRETEGVLNPIVFINPKIIKKSGEVVSSEGCLSFPDVYSDVKRAENVLVKATDIKGRSFTLEAKEGSLLSRAIQHEFDHLNGILFIDRCEDIDFTEQELAKHNLPKIQQDKLIRE